MDKKINNKSKNIIIILVVAILCAVVSGTMLFTYLQPQKTTVYVFKDNYSAGDVLTSDMLTAIQCDSSIVVAGAEADTSSRFVTGADITSVLNTGDSLRMDVSEGMPLTLSMLSVSGGSSVEMNMDPSKIAVTVAADNVSGVTPELKEGSRVNVYATGVDADGTTLLFQGMRVLAVNTGTNGLTSLTLECTADESLKLVYAANYASLYFGLIDSTGYEYTQVAEPSYVPHGTGQ